MMGSLDSRSMTEKNQIFLLTFQGREMWTSQSFKAGLSIEPYIIEHVVTRSRSSGGAVADE